MAEFIDPAIVSKVTLPSGEKVPCMGMGTFGSDRVSAEDVSAAVAGAIRSGYRMFDCAACYGNEHQIGEVFKTAFDEGVVERKDLFIMTKVWNDMHRKVEEACTKSIQEIFFGKPNLKIQKTARSVLIWLCRMLIMNSLQKQLKRNVRLEYKIQIMN